MTGVDLKKNNNVKSLVKKKKNQVKLNFSKFSEYQRDFGKLFFFGGGGK